MKLLVHTHRGAPVELDLPEPTAFDVKKALHDQCASDDTEFPVPAHQALVR